MNYNLAVLGGNLTRDPELRYTSNGQSVVDMSLAVNRHYSLDGEKKSEVSFFNIVAWGKQAEACANYLAKGSSVLVEGRLQQDTWEKDGQKRSAVKVIANRVEFLGGKKDKDEYYEDKERQQERKEEPVKDEEDESIPF
uniref:Putative single-stranded DNA-binding protein n=2 Tax=viral metagenome TaxID=1070528 RepID=A0A6H1ZY40_9ZZZZ